MLIDGLARTPGTLLHRELVGDAEGADWTLTEHLLAVVVDKLAQANWQRQAKKGSPKPDPVSPLAKKRHRGEAQHVGTGMPLEELLARLPNRAVGG